MSYKYFESPRALASSRSRRLETRTLSGSESGFSACEHDLGMKQGAGDAGGDGEEIALSGEDLDLARAGEFEEIDGASGADAGGGGFVGGDGGKLRQQPAGMDEVLFPVDRCGVAGDSRSLHYALFSLRENSTPVGMTGLRCGMTRVGGSCRLHGSPIYRSFIFPTSRNCGEKWGTHAEVHNSRSLDCAWLLLQRSHASLGMTKG